MKPLPTTPGQTLPAPVPGPLARAAGSASRALSSIRGKRIFHPNGTGYDATLEIYSGWEGVPGAGPRLRAPRDRAASSRGAGCPTPCRTRSASACDYRTSTAPAATRISCSRPRRADPCCSTCCCPGARGSALLEPAALQARRRRTAGRRAAGRRQALQAGRRATERRLEADRGSEARAPAT